MSHFAVNADTTLLVGHAKEEVDAGVAGDIDMDINYINLSYKTDNDYLIEASHNRYKPELLVPSFEESEVLIGKSFLRGGASALIGKGKINYLNDDNYYTVLKIRAGYPITNRVAILGSFIAKDSDLSFSRRYIANLSTRVQDDLYVMSGVSYLSGLFEAKGYSVSLVYKF